MAGQVMARTVNAMKYVIVGNMTPYAAALKAQINLSTMYKSRLYKQWKAGDLKGVREEIAKLDGSKAVPRK